ncbi:hypothetical protein EJ03DRAFT_136089 [Teratosphaeria nubilosa]|uniref:4Fe-4S ferredoxin-type domain-containing protein n=1 Tax=Teratosphaeria nubilosa TaxID=161662 RepID=A0A6G1L685_9PEZI|nr:hypothetical protein EJ03DRAFT_136089 [Teratosphaeria nubilosa]
MLNFCSRCSICSADCPALQNCWIPGSHNFSQYNSLPSLSRRTNKPHLASLCRFSHKFQTPESSADRECPGSLYQVIAGNCIFRHSHKATAVPEATLLARNFSQT